jgi:uncharacterized membrane protein YjgN (DUF898 family)
MADDTPQDNEDGASHTRLTSVRAPSLPPSPSGPTEHPLVFSGTAAEFFRIWIVNIGLTLVTLGIYAAWAKVRTKRYFYANTTLDGAPFDYLAKPTTILTGNLVALVALILYSLSSGLNPFMGLGVGLIFLIALPWIVMRSLKFRTNNTAWRNIRFGFDGGYGGAAYAYLLAPLTMGLTAGLTIPWADWVRRRLLFKHARFGTTPFKIENLGRKFYGIYLIAGLMLITIPLSIIVVSSIMEKVLPGTLSESVVSNLPILVVLLVSMPIFLLVVIYVKTRITNLMWNNTRLGEHTFRCNIKIPQLAWIYVSNTIAIMLTIGLAIPWAKIRTVRYQLNCMTMIAASDLTAFAAEQRDADPQLAIGEEIGEAMGVDIGL